MTLATYYWFSQTSLYNVRRRSANLPWHVMLRFLMAALAFLMISNVPYPVAPRTGFRSLRAIGGTLLLVGSMLLLATRRLEFFFPAALCYVAGGRSAGSSPVCSSVVNRRSHTISPRERTTRTKRRPRSARWTHRFTRRASPNVSRGRYTSIASVRGATGPSEASGPPRPCVPSAPREPSPDLRRVPEAPNAPSPPIVPPRRTARRASSVRTRIAPRARRSGRSGRSAASEKAARRRRPQWNRRKVVSAPSRSVAPWLSSAPATPVLSVVRVEEEVVSPGEGAERPVGDAGPTRKRKRRRRRGQRDRNAADTGEANGGADGAESSESGDFDDAGPDESGESVASESRPIASRSDVVEERIALPREPNAPTSPPTESDVRPPAAPPASTPLTTTTNESLSRRRAHRTSPWAFSIRRARPSPTPCTRSASAACATCTSGDIIVLDVDAADADAAEQPDARDVREAARQSGHRRLRDRGACTRAHEVRHRHVPRLELRLRRVSGGRRDARRGGRAVCGTRTTTCRAATSSSCRAASATATTCAPAPSPASVPIMQEVVAARGSRRPGARHLQRLPDRVRGGTAARRAAPQRSAQVRLRAGPPARRERATRCSRSRYERGQSIVHAHRARRRPLHRR